MNEVLNLNFTFSSNINRTVVPRELIRSERMRSYIYVVWTAAVITLLLYLLTFNKNGSGRIAAMVILITVALIYYIRETIAESACKYVDKISLTKFGILFDDKYFAAEEIVGIVFDRPDEKEDDISADIIVRVRDKYGKNRKNSALVFNDKQRYTPRDIASILNRWCINNHIIFIAA